MNAKTANSLPARQDRMLRERVHDTYRSERKLTEPTVCPVCKAVYQQGRWRWADAWPLDSRQETCPACLRIQDGYPAGEVVLTGTFPRQHRDEILSLLRRLEEEEKAAHPLHRIMRVDPRPDGLVVHTTDLHLPRRMGQALHDAYAGKLEMHYDEEGCFLRVRWDRHN